MRGRPPGRTVAVAVVGWNSRCRCPPVRTRSTPMPYTGSSTSGTSTSSAGPTAATPPPPRRHEVVAVARGEVEVVQHDDRRCRSRLAHAARASRAGSGCRGGWWARRAAGGSASWASARAMSTRCCSPPDRPPNDRDARCVAPTRAQGFGRRPRGPRRRLARRWTGAAAAEQHHLRDGERALAPALLHDDGDPTGGLARRERGKPLPVDLRRSRSGCCSAPWSEPQQRRLAAAVGADQAEHPTVRRRPATTACNTCVAP